MRNALITLALIAAIGGIAYEIATLRIRDVWDFAAVLGLLALAMLLIFGLIPAVRADMWRYVRRAWGRPWAP